MDSLKKYAKDFNNVEVVLRYDDDDTDHVVYENTKIISGERHGYLNLHRSYDECAAAASGNWLWVWADDILVETQNYDEIISHEKEFHLLNVHASNYAIHTASGKYQSPCPILPRKWYELLGHLAEAPIDCWACEICDNLNIFKDTPITVFHDHPRITGNNNDETFTEGQPPGIIDQILWNWRSKADIQARDQKIIAEYLARIS